MQVVLKPGGLIIIITIILLFSAIVLMNSQKRPTQEATNTKIVVPSASPRATIAPGVILQSDFETYAPSRPLNPETKAKILGEVTRGFFDNSEWAEVTATYSKDTTNPHSDSAAQKITVNAIKSGHVQFATTYLDQAKGTRVKGRIWLRAEADTPPGTIVVCIRDKADPNLFYARTAPKLTTNWQRFELAGTTSKSGELFFMVFIQNPNVTIYADDAEISKVL